jgi:hypothetical protein
VKLENSLGLTVAVAAAAVVYVAVLLFFVVQQVYLSAAQPGQSLLNDFSAWRHRIAM